MIIGEWWRRIRLILQRDEVADDLAEEMSFHQELRAERIRREGLPADEAGTAARRQFGHAITLQEASRAMWGFGSVDELRQDLRYAWRRLRQRPGFTLSVVGVLALGIGATTAMFSAVDAAMLRPLPFHQPARLAVLPNVQIGSDMREARFPPDKHIVYIEDVREMPDIFSDVAAFASGGLNLAESERPVRVNVGVVTANLFSTLGVAPRRGRAFNTAEGAPGGQSAVILSWRLWQRQYGGAAMEGTVIQLNGKPYTVVGVMPEGFSFPSESDLWIPLTVPTTSATYEPFRGYLPSTIIARVTPATPMPVASTRLTTRWEQAAFGASTPGQRSTAEDVLDQVKAQGAVIPLQRELVGDRRNALLILLGSTGLLLLIACANVTNLLLAQSAARGREIAVREVLGASRGRVVRQLLTESILLALGGVVLGIALAPLALGLISAITPAQLTGLAPARLDLRVLAFATILGLCTGIGFGIWPAFGSTRRAPGEIIKAGSRSATAAGAGHLRRMLVGVEIALTLMLLVGAGLMLRSFNAVMQVDSGLHADQVATVQLAFARSEGGRAVRLGRIEQMLQQLGTTPGISHAAAVNDLPLRGNGGISLSVEIDGLPPVAGEKMIFARWLQVSSGYFATLGIPMLRGRDFTALDDSLAPRVAIISEAMAKQFWRGMDPLGRTFHMPGDSIAVTVVGIVADVREAGLEESPRPQMYRPITETTPSNLALVARGALDPAHLLAQLTAAVRAVDPAQATYDLRMMDEVIGRSTATRRTGTLLITAFAALALLLAALGVYAVVSYGVSQRMRELGIRSALGATGYDLLGLLMREMAWVTALGISVGLAGAWVLTRVIASQLYAVTVHDPATFVVVPLVLLLASAAATLLPARRCFRVNPAEIIRSD